MSLIKMGYTAAHFRILQSFSLSDMDDSMQRNIHHSHAYREAFLKEKAVAAHQADLTQVMD